MFFPLFDRLPRRRFPFVNYLFIIINVAVFLWERIQIVDGVPEKKLLLAWGLVPSQMMRAPLEHASTVLTSMFMHDPGTWKHIGYNMLFLWIFGDNVEDALGHARYIAFYLFAGVCAAAAQVLPDPGSPVAMVGASGAIAGVLAAYVSLFPNSPITVLNPIPILWLFFGILIEIPAWVVILFFFVTNVVLSFWSALGVTTNIAFYAHLGGFVAGLALIRLMLPAPPWRDHDRWQGFRPSRRDAWGPRRRTDWY